MEVQEVIVIALFAVAILYVGRIIYRGFQIKSGCGQNCKCGVDFSKMPVPEEEK